MLLKQLQQEKEALRKKGDELFNLLKIERNAIGNLTVENYRLDLEIKDVKNHFPDEWKTICKHQRSQKRKNHQKLKEHTINAYKLQNEIKFIGERIRDVMNRIRELEQKQVV